MQRCVYSYAGVHYHAPMNEVQQLLNRVAQGGLSQTAISKKTGIPQPRLSRWFKGKAPVGAADALKLKRLCEELDRADGVSPSRVEASAEARCSSET